MKNLLQKLNNPHLFFASDLPTNFLNEIYNGKETNRVTKSYLKSFSRERLLTEKEQRKTDIYLNIYMTVFVVIAGLLIYLALNR